MKSVFRFIIQTETFAGIGYHQKIAEVLEDKGYGKVLVMVDAGVAGTAPCRAVRDTLERRGQLAGFKVTRGNEEPDYAYLDEVAAELRPVDTDCILGMGGGSTLDLVKAVAVLHTNPGSGLEYRGFDKVKTPGVPVMAVPTTAGTASEVTINAVFTNKAEKRKLGINGKYLNAAYAVLDPEFTISAPVAVAVSSGMDALVHALESFVGSGANKMTRVFSKEAFRLLYHALPSIIDEPANLEKRLDIQLGAYNAGIALFNSSSGIAGAISYPLGTHYGVPHGIGGGMFAVPVVKYNVDHGYYEYAELYDLIKGANRELSVEEKSKEFVRLLGELTNKLKVPQTLSAFSITAGNRSHVIDIMQGLQAAFDQNPVRLDVKEVGMLIDPLLAS